MVFAPAAHAQTTSTRTGDMAWLTAATTSFNEAAGTTNTVSVNLNMPQQPPAAPTTVSPWWAALLLPGVAFWALRRRQATARADRSEDDDDAPAGWAITRWMHGSPSGAKGWRLSRFEELPDTELTPLYGSLDDDEAAPNIDNVVPLHRAEGSTKPRSRRPHATLDSTEVIDIEARLVPRGQ